ncbi:MAG: polyprenyl synthetase family protein [Candidatus Omnitrophota bacterium]
MIFKIRKHIEKELSRFVRKIDKIYSLSKISPFLSKSIKDFVLRDGKRVRPILFVIGYLGYAKKIAKNLYTSALAIELLHDFLLVHDDIIDKSDTRRGKPSMHAMLNKYCANHKSIKFNGQDLALIIGDIMYAMSIHAFLSINEKMERKEKALKKFIMAAMHTGSGEFIELIYSINDIGKITKKDILKVYDYKTASYTFSGPLSSGAILAGASQNQADKLFKYGTYLGRAFQIKDDMLSLFGSEKEIGKSALTDLQESKKTLPLWFAYNNSNKKDKLLIKEVFSKKKVNKTDLFHIRKIIKTTSTLDFAKKEISKLIKKAENIIVFSQMHTKYKGFLSSYSKELLCL